MNYPSRHQQVNDLHWISPKVPRPGWILKLFPSGSWYRPCICEYSVLLYLKLVINAYGLFQVLLIHFHALYKRLPPSGLLLCLQVLLLSTWLAEYHGNELMNSKLVSETFRNAKILWYTTPASQRKISVLFTPLLWPPHPYLSAKGESFQVLRLTGAVDNLFVIQFTWWPCNLNPESSIKRNTTLYIIWLLLLVVLDTLSESWHIRNDWKWKHNISRVWEYTSLVLRGILQV